MTSPELLVSVGLPLYNAGEHTRRILDNLIAQDYPNIEIIISDNASEDQTWAICQEYAERDNRIRLSRNSENRGYMYNFYRVFELATGEYFMWAAHDDLWDATFISQCSAALAAHPQAVLCYTDQMHIREDTDEGKVVQFAGLKLDQDRVSERLHHLLTFRPRPHAILYGLFRSDALARTLPAAAVPSADIALLVRVMMQGQAIHVPQVLYTRSVRKSNVEFRTRMKMLRPGQDLPPNFVIVLQTLAILIRDVWGRGASASLWEKLNMTRSIAMYVFSSFSLQFIPRPLQPAARRLKKRIMPG